MVIQPFSSRFETPRVQLSNEAFTNTGINLFFSEKVPFADRTGLRFAKNIVNLFEERIGKLKKKKGKIHIYELGAGTGILALRILDYLKSRNLSLYQQIVLHISDISRPTIAELAKIGKFKAHSSRIVFEIINAVNPRFKYKPLLIYFTDLIDALPCRHIQTINGQIFEIQVQTFVDDNAQVVDTVKYPPTALNPKIKLSLAPQLIKIFKEEYRKIPIDGLKNMSQEEKLDLKKLTSIFINDRIFNYSFSAKHCLRNCLAALEPGGFILFSDFGTTSKESPDLSMWSEFGITIFFAVDFYSIKQDFEKSGSTVMLASNTPGGPQEMLFDTLGGDKIFEKKFHKYFGWNNQQKIDEFLTKTKNILQSENLQKDYKLKMINDLYKALPQILRRDYQILNDLALFHQMFGFDKQALMYTRLIENEYGHTAGVYCYLIRGRVYQSLGDFILAEENYRKASALNSPAAIYELANFYMLQKRTHDYIKTMRKYLKFTNQSDFLKSLFLISTAHEITVDIASAKEVLGQIIKLGDQMKNISDGEKSFLEQAKTQLAVFTQKSTLDYKGKSFSCIWDQNTIAFLLGKQFTPWTPDGLNKPVETFLGGSEEAVVYLSEELTKLGWKITVYGEPSKKEGIYRGVRWLNYYRFNPKDRFNILAYWRNPQMIDLSCRASQIYFWTHDADLKSFFSEERLSKLDKIIVLSRAHRKTLPNIEKRKFLTSANGLHEHFPRIKPRNNPHWCIWTSSYDRGLEYLLAIWPDVVKKIPDAKLHIFYGWQIFDIRFKNEPRVLAWKNEIEQLMQQPGVTHHGKVSQTEIEKWYKKCGIFAYPSHFFEISCVSAMKAQAFGTIPVTTTIGALSETVQFGIKIRGDINKPKVLEEYKKALIKVLKDPKWQAGHRKKMMRWAKNKYSWANVAKQWSDEFKLFKNKKN